MQKKLNQAQTHTHTQNPQNHKTKMTKQNKKTHTKMKILFNDVFEIQAHWIICVNMVKVESAPRNFLHFLNILWVFVHV